MPSWKEILEQFAMIQAAPIPFIVVTIAIAGLIWLAFNWAYGSIISNKNSLIDLLNTKVTDYKDKLSGATPEEAKARINNLEARLARIEPRRLSAEQREIIRAQAQSVQQSNPNISIQSDASCTDCNQYAGDFQSVLEGANWTTTMSKVLGASAASPKGIAILTPDPSKPLPEAGALMAALTAAKIPFELNAGYDFSKKISGQITIAVVLITARTTF